MNLQTHHWASIQYNKTWNQAFKIFSRKEIMFLTNKYFQNFFIQSGLFKQYILL